MCKVTRRNYSKTTCVWINAVVNVCSLLLQVKRSIFAHVQVLLKMLNLIKNKSKSKIFNVLHFIPKLLFVIYIIQLKVFLRLLYPLLL
jgi:hypothetical protein